MRPGRDHRAGVASGASLGRAADRGDVQADGGIRAADHVRSPRDRAVGPGERAADARAAGRRPPGGARRGQRRASGGDRRQRPRALGDVRRHLSRSGHRAGALWRRRRRTRCADRRGSRAGARRDRAPLGRRLARLPVCAQPAQEPRVRRVVGAAPALGGQPRDGAQAAGDDGAHQPPRDPADDPRADARVPRHRRSARADPVRARGRGADSDRPLSPVRGRRLLWLDRRPVVAGSGGVLDRAAHESAADRSRAGDGDVHRHRRLDRAPVRGRRCELAPAARGPRPAHSRVPDALAGSRDQDQRGRVSRDLRRTRAGGQLRRRDRGRRRVTRADGARRGPHRRVRATRRRRPRARGPHRLARDARGGARARCSRRARSGTSLSARGCGSSTAARTRFEACPTSGGSTRSSAERPRAGSRCGAARCWAR